MRDVDIFNYAEVCGLFHAVNPEQDIVVIPGPNSCDGPSCPESRAGSAGLHRIGGKVIIDATNLPSAIQASL